MKVHIYADQGTGMVVLLEPAPGKGKIPLLIRGITEENVAEAVLPAITEMRRPRAPKQEPLG